MVLVISGDKIYGVIPYLVFMHASYSVIVGRYIEPLLYTRYWTLDVCVVEVLSVLMKEVMT